MMFIFCNVLFCLLINIALMNWLINNVINVRTKCWSSPMNKFLIYFGIICFLIFKFNLRKMRCRDLFILLVRYKAWASFIIFRLAHLHEINAKFLIIFLLFRLGCRKESLLLFMLLIWVERLLLLFIKCYFRWLWILMLRCMVSKASKFFRKIYIFSFLVVERDRTFTVPKLNQRKIFSARILI